MDSQITWITTDEERQLVELQKKKGRGGKSGKTSRAKETGGKLPEHLVEMIISKIPFPSLFKAIVLSRSWYFKFPLASQRTRSLSLSFQNHVISESYKWPTYCPVVLGRSGIVGFDQATSRWQTLMDFCHLPIQQWSYSACAGPLICVAEFVKNYSNKYLRVFVTNALIRSWRELPDFLPPDNDPLHLKLSLNGSHAYSVLAIFLEKSWPREGLYSVYYDSICGTCTSSPAKSTSDRPNDKESAYLDGKLYCMCDNLLTKKMNLWRYTVKKNTWDCVRSTGAFHDLADCGVLLCGDKVMVAVCRPPEEYDRDYVTQVNPGHKLYTPSESIRVYELDTVTLELRLVARGPPRDILGVGLSPGSKMNFTSDANSIYFGLFDVPGIPILTCNIQSFEWDTMAMGAKKWGCLPPASYEFQSEMLEGKTSMNGAFEPGLSPFVNV